MLESLLSQSMEYDLNKFDHLAETEHLSFDEYCRLSMPPSLFGAVEPLKLNDWALSQACSKLGVPLDYARRCSEELRAYNFNYWLDAADRTWFVRGYKNHARAILSADYTPISNTEVLKLAIETLGSQENLLIRPWISADDLYIKIMTIVMENGRYGIGVTITNGETGNRMLKVSPFIQRTSCQNSIVYLAGGWEQRHIHVSQAYLRGAFVEKFGQAIGISADMLEKIVAAEMEAIPKFAKQVENICKRKGLINLKDLVLMGSENSHTRMGLVNGFSYAAQQVDSLDQEIALEALAGEILMQGLRVNDA